MPPHFAQQEPCLHRHLVSPLARFLEWRGTAPERGLAAVEKRVHGDAANPGVETRVAAKAADLPERAQPRFLRKVVRFSRIAREMKRKHVNSTNVRLRQFRERIAVAALRRRDELPL